MRDTCDISLPATALCLGSGTAAATILDFELSFSSTEQGIWGAHGAFIFDDSRFLGGTWYASTPPPAITRTACRPPSSTIRSRVNAPPPDGGASGGLSRDDRARQQPADRRDLDLPSPGINIHVFGESTVFGYGVDDESTVPSHLQRELSTHNPDNHINVFNFGQEYNISTQQLTLLLQLFRKDLTPNITVFIDGLNESRVRPYYTREMRSLFKATGGSEHLLLSNYVSRMPIMTLARKMLKQAARSVYGIGRYDGGENGASGNPRKVSR